MGNFLYLNEFNIGYNLNITWCISECQNISELEKRIDLSPGEKLRSMFENCVLSDPLCQEEMRSFQECSQVKQRQSQRIRLKTTVRKDLVFFLY